MAQSINLWNATYSDVPSILLPRAGGGTAQFVDVTDTTAAAADVASGKYFYTSGGVKTQGTASGGGNLQTKSVSFTPTESAQSASVTADSGYDGLDTVNVSVGAISSTYVGSGIERKGTADMLVSGSTVVAPSGYYESMGVRTIALGTEGTPTATKGTVSNHSIDVTPSVTNSAGYINGSTKTGTAVTVTASELVSGSETKTANGTYDVTNLASLVVNVSGGSSNWTLLGTKDCGTISTSSTTAATINKDFTVSGVGAYDLLVVETSVNTKTNGRHAATARLIWLTAGSDIGTKNGATLATAVWNVKLSSGGVATSRSNTTARGVYPYSCTLSTSNSVTSAAIVMYACYNSTQTGTINGTYTARVYGVKLYDLIGG